MAATAVTDGKNSPVILDERSKCAKQKRGDQAQAVKGRIPICDAAGCLCRRQGRVAMLYRPSGCRSAGNLTGWRWGVGDCSWLATAIKDLVVLLVADALRLIPSCWMRQAVDQFSASLRTAAAARLVVCLGLGLDLGRHQAFQLARWLALADEPVDRRSQPPLSNASQGWTGWAWRRAANAMLSLSARMHADLGWWMGESACSHRQ